MFPQNPINLEWYDDSLNSPMLWVLFGRELICAADDLKAIGSKSQTMFYDRIYLMLLGFGVENLLKGWHVGQGNTMAEGGKLKKTPGRPHDLAELAEYVSFAVTEEERTWLRRLSYFSRFMGRYPGPTNIDEVWNGEQTIGVPWGEDSECIIRKIIQRLISQEIPSKKIQPNANALTD